MSSAQENADARFGPAQRERLRELARASIEHGLQHGAALPITAAQWPVELLAPGASFVTLRLDGALRGCIGSIEANRPLAEDVARNAYAAAFADPRFAPISAAEAGRLILSLSVLGPLEDLPAASADELCARLQPHVDGLVIAAQGRRGVFLPQVWEQLPRPQDFLQALLRKAGLPATLQPPQLRTWRFAVEHF